MIKHFIKDLAMARDYLREELDWPVKIKDQEVDPKRYKRRDFLLTQTHLGPIVEIRLSDGQVFTDHHQRFHWEEDWGLCYEPEPDVKWGVCHTINPAQIVSYSVKTPSEEQIHKLWMKVRAKGLEDDLPEVDAEDPNSDSGKIMPLAM